MIALYLAGSSPVHRLPAGVKLLVLALSGTALFFVDQPGLLLLALALVALCYRLAGVGAREAGRQLRQLIWLPVALFLVHLLSSDWLTGVIAVLRYAALVALAILVTLTTKSRDLIAVILRVLGPLGRVGLPVERIALMLSMTLRYIPLIYAGYLDIREARQARGASGGTVSVLMPLLVRSLRQADALADAIDVRGYDPHVAATLHARRSSPWNS